MIDAMVDGMDAEVQEKLSPDEIREKIAMLSKKKQTAIDAEMLEMAVDIKREISALKKLLDEVRLHTKAAKIDAEFTKKGKHGINFKNNKDAGHVYISSIDEDGLAHTCVHSRTSAGSPHLTEPM